MTKEITVGRYCVTLRVYTHEDPEILDVVPPIHEDDQDLYGQVTMQAILESRIKGNGLPPAWIGQEHFYFTSGVLEQLGARDLGIGQDHFVQTLWPYAEVLANMEPHNFDGVFSYEFSEVAAPKVYWKLVDEGQLTLKRFRLLVELKMMDLCGE